MNLGLAVEKFVCIAVEDGCVFVLLAPSAVGEDNIRPAISPAVKTFLTSEDLEDCSENSGAGGARGWIDELSTERDILAVSVKMILCP